MSWQVAWYVGWLLAIALLVFVGMKFATSARLENSKRWLILALFGLLTAAVLGLAQYAIVENDSHLDLTRNKAFTPHNAALELVDSLTTPVAVTYFGHDDDPKAKRIKVILESLARRSPMLSVTVTDPDKDPLLARRYDVKFYNIAVVEALGHRVLASTTNEVDIAIAIQKALRQKQPSVCFISGHGELEITNEEFHTHIESVSGGAQNSHHHGHAHIPVVQTTQHGVGRLRRSLEGLGFVVSTLNLTTDAAPDACDTIAIVGPKHPYLPTEIEFLKSRYHAGSSIVVLLDLGAKLPLLNGFLSQEGISLNDDVVIDEKQHHEQDIETLAVSSYPSHVITDRIAMTLFPGSRSLKITKEDGLVIPLVKGSVSSQSFSLVNSSHHSPDHHHDENGHIEESGNNYHRSDENTATEPTIMAIKEATDNGGKLLVGGDADFLSNSYYPYLSNSSLAISIFRWAVGESDAVKIEPSLPVVETIVLSQPQMRALFLLLVLGLPGSILALGVVVWWKNR